MQYEFDYENLMRLLSRLLKRSVDTVEVWPNVLWVQFSDGRCECEVVPRSILKKGQHLWEEALRRRLHRLGYKRADLIIQGVREAGDHVAAFSCPLEERLELRFSPKARADFARDFASAWVRYCEAYSEIEISDEFRKHYIADLKYRQKNSSQILADRY